MRIKAITLVAIMLLSWCFLCGYATDATESEKTDTVAEIRQMQRTTMHKREYAELRRDNATYIAQFEA